MNGNEDPKAPKNGGKNVKKTEPWRALRAYMPFLMLTVMSLWLWQGLFDPYNAQLIAYSDFKSHLARKEVAEVALTDTEVRGLIVPTSTPSAESNAAAAVAAGKDPWYAPLLPPSLQPRSQGSQANAPKPMYFHTVRVEDPQLIGQLEAAGVKFTGVRPSLLSQFLWSWILPLGLMFFLWSFLARRISPMGQSVLNIGKSRAKLIVDKSTGVTFDDVAGCDEAKHELKEVVDFLQAPDRYKALGAQVPKGVLLVGPPGTGKTLLARAVAGEAGVPFFSISGSDFVEMFVGVGAARVRDLFKEAKAQAPCIVFIDEIDTVGRTRSVNVGLANDEREQTLNQLLAELDGFEPNAGVIVLAATNRPEVLDRALLRPGRFDRQVLIDAPDLEGREAVLRVHTRKKPLAPEVDLRRVAQSTPGFSGADLANAVNEAALLAARRNQKMITQRDMDDAVEKVVAGPERRSRRLVEAEKERVAYHESGHALVGALCKNADPVRKISIVPRGRSALGYTLQIPEMETFLLTQSALKDKVRGMLGGRAAEEQIFSEVSTGAENDLEKASALARQMVGLYGMGRRVRLTHFGRERSMYLPGDSLDMLQKNVSEETARAIDEDVQAILDEAYADARSLLRTHERALHRIARELIAREILDEDDLGRLFKECGIERNPNNGRAARILTDGRMGDGLGQSLPTV